MGCKHKLIKKVKVQMKSIVDKILKDILSEKINNVWKACSKTGIKIPYTVEEAGFNSLLLASIYEYIKEFESEEYSFAVSEATIERYGNKRCRADIIWYRKEAVCYFELKGSCYGEVSSSTDVSNCKKSIDYANYQLQGINYKNNEEWYYKYEEGNLLPENRYGCCLAMIQSINNDGKSNFNEIKEELGKNKEIHIFYSKLFDDDKLPIITDGDKKYKNDGYFIIGYMNKMQ